MGRLCYPGRPPRRACGAGLTPLHAVSNLSGRWGIDRSYYGPLTGDDLAGYARQLPAGFRCVMKAWSALTTPFDAKTGHRSPTFLDPGTAITEVLDPVRRAFGDHIGAIVFEFPPFRGRKPTSEELANRLDRFFRALPPDLPYAVEVRNRELLDRPYLDALRAHRVTHVINLWEAMPDVGAQMALPGIDTGPTMITRLLLRPGTRYAERKKAMAPFDRIRDPNPKMRADVVELSRLAGVLKKVLYVLINNKAEGSSPLTARALAELLAR